jgi:hypothetical protein
LNFDGIDRQSNFSESIDRCRAPAFDGVVNCLGGGQLKLIEEFPIVHTLIPEESGETGDGF